MKVKDYFEISTAIKTEIRYKDMYHNVDILLKKVGTDEWEEPCAVRKYKSFIEYNTYISLPAEVLEAEIIQMDVNSASNAITLITK